MSKTFATVVVSKTFATVVVSSAAGVAVARGKPTVLGARVTQLLSPDLASATIDSPTAW